MPTSTPMRLNVVAMKPDSTSVRPSSARCSGSAGATLVDVGAADQAAGEHRPDAPQRATRGCPLFEHAALTGIFSSTIFFYHSAGPVLCTEVPFASTATVTGMSFTSNS